MPSPAGRKTRDDYRLGYAYWPQPDGRVLGYRYCTGVKIPL